MGGEFSLPDFFVEMKYHRKACELSCPLMLAGSPPSVVTLWYPTGAISSPLVNCRSHTVHMDYAVGNKSNEKAAQCMNIEHNSTQCSDIAPYLLP